MIIQITKKSSSLRYAFSRDLRTSKTPAKSIPEWRNSENLQIEWLRVYDTNL